MKKDDDIGPFFDVHLCLRATSKLSYMVVLQHDKSAKVN